jgi:predicted N-acyltransferase
MKCIFLKTINAISADSWNSVVNSDYPFLRHEFLSAMESSRSACTQTGWQPQHLIVYDNGIPVAVMPLYLKSHSYGEYIFDWNWAGAYERHGLNYYPKLLSAIPFTPATGPRLACLEPVGKEKIYAFVSASLKEHARVLNASSIHILASGTDEASSWNSQGLRTRTSCQFHWLNNDYLDFDDFLNFFSSRKRKNVRKERRLIDEQCISIQTHIGYEITSAMWDTFYNFYQLTYAKRSGHGGYLRREFFDLIHESMPEQLMLVLAEHRGQYVAGALYFFDSTTLYGRYWGCDQELEMLHFEVCYYQGIDFCIKNGLLRFDAGAQGEHKIQRGFVPTPISSNHWIKNPEFADAINDFIIREAEGNRAYIEDAKNYLPFKKG